MNFKVRAPNDAHLILCGARNETHPVIEVFIGGWKNTKSVIRYNQQKPDVYECETPNILDANQFRGFWVRATDGVITVGNEGEAAAFLSWRNPEPFQINYFGVCTGWGATGDWIIDGKNRLITIRGLSNQSCTCFFLQTNSNHLGKMALIHLLLIHRARHAARLARCHSPTGPATSRRLWGRRSPMLGERFRRWSVSGIFSLYIYRPNLLEYLSMFGSFIVAALQASRSSAGRHGRFVLTIYFPQSVRMRSEVNQTFLCRKNCRRTVVRGTCPSWIRPYSWQISPISWVIHARRSFRARVSCDAWDCTQDIFLISRSPRVRRLCCNCSVAYVSYGGGEHPYSEYEVLCGCQPNWVQVEGNNLPQNAIPAGETGDG